MATFCLANPAILLCCLTANGGTIGNCELLEKIGPRRKGTTEPAGPGKPGASVGK